MQDTLLPITAILIALLLGAMSPGPSLIYIAQIAAKSGRRAAVRTSIGMGLGGMVFAILSLLGMGAALAHAPSAFFLLRILGACYLAYLAFNIWRKATESVAFDDDGFELAQSSGLLPGFGVQIANPKTIIVYSSVFIAALPEGLDFMVGIFLVFSIFMLEFGWYAFVGSIFSSDAPRRAYARAKLGVDSSAALAMGCLAIKVAWDALQSIRT